MRNKISIVLLIILLLPLVGCVSAPLTPTINGTDLSEFTIIYNSDDLDYSKRAAEYIQGQIEARTGISLAVCEDDDGSFDYEIVVGETGRDISVQFNPETKGTEFAILANDHQVALEGKYFTIAAAAYYFVETYITDTPCNASIPKKITVHKPIVKEAKNVIFLIGDGMGQYQTLMHDYLEVPSNAKTDGEDLFYGYMLPYRGLVRTDSLSGTTDSAASATALATGYKTINAYVGLDRYYDRVESLTELAGSMGMATAVMSTETQTGATPAGFSAHAKNRDEATTIRNSQTDLQKKYGTRIVCSLADYNLKTMEKKIQDTLSVMSQSESGFFLMYEEAHIDKNCHRMNVSGAFTALIRFNQAIGLFMEYAFYHPDTFVLITADHETGSMKPDSTGKIICNTDVHSSADVPVFVHGSRGELFNGKVIENVQIPKTIAKLWGITKFGDHRDDYPALF